MNREEFLRQLEMLLSDVSEEERADAMAYYRSYFEDAGDGNEASIIEELESPQKVAESIKKDLGIISRTVNESRNTQYQNGQSYGQSNPYQNNQTYGQGNPYQNGQPYGQSNPYQNGQTYGQQNVYTEKKKMDTTTMVLLIIIAVLTSPLWIGLVMGAFGILVGLIATIFALAVSIVAIVFSLLVTGVALIIGGFVGIIGGELAAGLGVIGGGFIVLALGILAVIPCVLFIGKAVPAMIRGIVELCRKPFDKRKGVGV